MPLYPFQRRITEALRKGYNVLVQAPTGSGKTRGALYHYLETWDRDQPEEFPRKCIYSVPLRTLANQFEQEFREIARGLGLRRSMEVSVQTGARPEDLYLERDLIFATIDQTLSNFLNIPYSLSNRLANLNAGAIISSFLVFDEFHLFGPQNALPTTLCMLHMLRGVTPFVAMSATFSATLLSTLAEWLEAEVVTVSTAELEEIPSQRRKMRQFQIMETEMTAQAILEKHHGHRRSIAICNTVDRAQQLYRALRQLAPAETKIDLLHSRFLREDRLLKELWIQQEFGKEKTWWTAESLILVATQVVEVGLDITCEVMHTEIAPATSLVQRAGRCARFAGESGTVYVYRVPERENGEPNYAPYIGEEAKLCEETWISLAAYQGKPLDFQAEQTLIEAVHGPYDAQLVDRLRTGRYAHQRMIAHTITNQERGLARQLIREVDSRAVIVHPEPHALDNPWLYEPFNLYRGSLFGAVSPLKELAASLGLDWFMMGFIEREDPEQDSHKPSYYEVIDIQQSEELQGVPLVAIHPALATYDIDIGFRLGEGGEFVSPPVQWEGRRERGGGEYSYQKETYVEHIQGLYQAYQRRLYEEIAYISRRLEETLQLAPHTIDYTLRLCFAFHDLGKLSRAWQEWTHRWQELIGEPVSSDILLAHTDYDPTRGHRELQRQMGRKRPPHAVEGARATLDLLPAFWNLQTASGEMLARAVITAIARHHASSAAVHEAYRFHPAAPKVLQEALAVVRLEKERASRVPSILQSQPASDVQDVLIRAEQAAETILYFLFVRILRLADQQSQSAR